MTREEKIQAIYEEVADWIYDSYSEDETIFPVMIWDCLDWINENTPDNENRNMIFNYWQKLRLPIEEQSEECIWFVYNLIK